MLLILSVCPLWSLYNTVPKKQSKVWYNWFLQKCYNSFVEISCFELWTFWRQFLGTVVKNAKHKKVTPGIYLHFFISPKIGVSLFWSLKCVSPKYNFFGPRSKPGPQPDTASYPVPAQASDGVVYPLCFLWSFPSVVEDTCTLALSWPLLDCLSFLSPGSYPLAPSPTPPIPWLLLPPLLFP